MVCLNPATGPFFKKQLAAKRTGERFGRTPRMREAGHLEAIRACPCLKCGTEGRGIIEAAHVRMSSAAHGKRGGIGEKPDDRWTVPLCTECHREQHRIGELSFWNEIDVNPLNAAERLYAVSPNDEKMRGVVKDIILERRQ